MRDIFFINYHVGVDQALLDDLEAVGCTVYMPANNWGRISFYADCLQFKNPNIKFITYEEFLALPRLAMIIPCCQLLNDMNKLEADRGGQDAVIYITAQDDYGKYIKSADYVMSHDLIFHRQNKAKYKMLYLNRPSWTPEVEKDFELAYQNKRINSYISDFHTHPPYLDGARMADEFASKYGEVKFYGHLEREGIIPRTQLFNEILSSMFTLCFKGSETWGQGVLESMLLETPVILYKPFLTSMFSEYLVNEDTAIIVDSVDDALNKVKSISLEEYETLGVQARAMAELLTSPEPRRKQLSWFLNKIL